MRILLSFLLTSLAFGAPQNPEAKPAVFGRVIDAATHELVHRVNIKIYTSKDQWDDISDGEGRFRFSALPPGDYTLIAHRDGYSDRPIQLTRSTFDDHRELLIELHRQGVISGRIVNGFGQGIRNANVEGLRMDTTAKSIEVAGSEKTNDLGEYRLSGLDPGTYQVRATYREGRNDEFDTMPLTIASAYFGPAGKPSDVPVTVGTLTSGIDFVLEPVRPVVIRGKLRTLAGAVSGRTNLWIIGAAGEGGHNAQAVGGEFAITDVPSGRYTISGEAQDKTKPMFGVVEVEVRDLDVDGVDLELKAIPQIDAEIRVSGQDIGDLKLDAVYFLGAQKVRMTSMEIGHPDKSGKFSVSLPPDEYRLSFGSSLTALGIQNVLLDGQPVTDWTFRLDNSPQSRKMIITLESQGQQ